MGVVGIDFGSRGIRMVQVRQNADELQVVGVARQESPRREDTPDPQRLAEQIRAAFTAGGFTGRKCVVSLPRNHIRLQSIRLPRLPDLELRQAAEWEASQRFGLARESMQVDFIRTGATLQSGESKEEILLIAASHESIDARVLPVLDAGLRPLAIETEFTALARALSRHYRRDADLNIVRVVLDVGLTGSTVMILRGDQIAFCKPLVIGGDKLNAAVADHLQLDHTAAEELRAARLDKAASGGESDVPIDPATDRAVYEAVRPLMGDLVKEVLLCLRYYGVTFRGQQPERIILTGSEGLEPRLDTMLSQTCKVPVEFDSRPATLDGLTRQIDSILNCRTGPPGTWGVAAGLSMRGMGTPRQRKRDMATQVSSRGAA
ncbi:MAG: pilus assembly protein PilM [Planctomycetota bacterium]